MPAANFTLSVEDVAFLKEEIDNYDMVILQNEIPEEVNIAVAEFAKAKGVPVMLNPAPATQISKKLISCLTYISPNEHEAETITGISSESEDVLNKSVEAFHNMGAKNVLITLGKEGCVFSDGKSKVKVSSMKVESVVDPTAAGDSFIGAFCTAVTFGVSIEKALYFANCTAGITVSRMGAQTSLPTFDEVISVMKNNGYETECYNMIKGE